MRQRRGQRWSMGVNYHAARARPSKHGIQGQMEIAFLRTRTCTKLHNQNVENIANTGNRIIHAEQMPCYSSLQKARIAHTIVTYHILDFSLLLWVLIRIVSSRRFYWVSTTGSLLRIMLLLLLFIIIIIFTPLIWTYEITWVSLWEKGPYGICNQCKSRSACVFAQSDLGLHYLLNASSIPLEQIRKHLRPQNDHLDEQADLDLQSLKCDKGLFVIKWHIYKATKYHKWNCDKRMLTSFLLFSLKNTQYSIVFFLWACL